MQFEASNPIDSSKKRFTPMAVDLKRKWKPPENDYIDTQSLQGEEREQFILDYMGLVEMIACDIIRGKPQNIEIGDLIQSGLLGLLDAMKKYDPNRKILFHTFADLRIKGAMFDFLRKNDHFSRITRERTEKVLEMLERNKHRVKNGLKPLTDEEMAKELGVNADKFRNYLSLTSPNDIHEPLDKFLVENGDSKDTLDSKTKQPDELAHEKDIKEIMRIAMAEFLLGVKSEKRKSQFRDLYEQYYVEEKKSKDICKNLNISPSLFFKLLAEMRNGIKGILETRGIRIEDTDWGKK